MLGALAWGVLALIALVLAALSLPLYLRLSARAAPGLGYAIDAIPFRGLGPRVRVADSARKKAAPRKKPQTKPRRAGRGAMPKGLVRLGTDILAKLRLRRVEVRAEVGLGDPAATGAFFGMLTPILYGLDPDRPLDIAVTPDFETAGVRGHAMVEIGVVPISLLPAAVRFGLRQRKGGGNRNAGT